MALIRILHLAAALVSPAVLMAAVLAVGGAAVLAFGRATRRAARQAWLGPGLFLLASGGWLLAARWGGAAPLRLWWAGGAAAIVLLVHLRWGRVVPRGGFSGLEEPRLAAAYAAVAWAAVTVLLLDNLGGYAGTMMVWEPSVVAGFGEALRHGTGTLRFLADRLLWDDGLVSRGDTSLIYGAATYALFHVAGLSQWTLRVVAALAAMLSVPALFLATRRPLGPAAAAAAAALLAVSPVLLYYGRYGTSLSGTLLGSLLALGSVLWLVDRGWQRWWGGALCGAALFVATLGYSPARPVALALAVQGFVTLALRGRRLRTRGAVSLALLLAVLAGAWGGQVAGGSASAFVRARGESILNFARQGDYLRDYLGRRVAPDQVGLGERVVLVGRVLQRTVPELGRVLTYAMGTEVDRNQVLESDPPRLPFLPAALTPFVLWGFLLFLRRLRSPAHLATVVWCAAAVGPVLLTTRVDAHRLMLLVVPLALWGGAGLVEAARTLAAAGVPSVLGHALAAMLLIGAVLGNVVLLCDEAPRPDRLAAAVTAELARLQGPVAVAATGDHRTVGEIDLALLERQRSRPEAPDTLLPENIVAALRDPLESPSFAYAIQRLPPDGATLLLVPAQPFRHAAFELQHRGSYVVQLGAPEAAFWRVDAEPPTGGRRATVLTPWPTPTPTPTPALVSLRPGRQIRVGELEPLRVDFGFAPPVIDQAWGGGPLMLGGVHYRHGIGMHAWTRMTYAVPEGAKAFQAVVGLADSERGCEAALVTFEVRGSGGELLFDSGAVGPITPPRLLLVELRGQSTITLVVTEGGNGRDCDHASWAEAAFLLDDE